MQIFRLSLAEIYIIVIYSVVFERNGICLKALYKNEMAQTTQRCKSIVIK